MARGTPIEEIVAAYERYGHLGLAAAAVGLKRESVTQRLKKAGVIALDRKAWTPRDNARVRAEYRWYVTAGSAEGLALALGRSHGAVIDRAFRLGVTEARIATDLLDIEFAAVEATTTVETSPPCVMLTVPGAPVSKARARVGAAGHFHTPPRVREAEQALSARLATVPLRFDGNLSLNVVFVLADARLVDGDNLLKLVQDAGNDSGIWIDDSQITKTTVQLTIDREYPRTHIMVMQYVDKTIPRGTAHLPLCAGCGEPFKPAKRKVPPVTCSAECAAEAALTLL